jgi:hypothetical protein
MKRDAHGHPWTQLCLGDRKHGTRQLIDGQAAASDIDENLSART